MRISPKVLVLFCALSIPACAASFDDKVIDQQSLDALEQRASAAQPKEQCFLYAQLLLRHTAFRLTELLHEGGFEDRPLVEQTLAQLNQAQSEAMLQVFRK